jgi:hypothetical protein
MKKTLLIVLILTTSAGWAQSPTPLFVPKIQQPLVVPTTRADLGPTIPPRIQMEELHFVLINKIDTLAVSEVKVWADQPGYEPVFKHLSLPGGPDGGRRKVCEMLVRATADHRYNIQISFIKEPLESGNTTPEVVTIWYPASKLELGKLASLTLYLNPDKTLVFGDAVYR